MSDPYFQTLFADRIGGPGYGKGSAIYKFEKIKRAKRAAIADFPHRALLDFGIGENDDMAPASVRSTMKVEIDKLENRGYADNGIHQFNAAAARFMQREFGVKLDPELQINHCIGSKPALAMIPAAFINPGDITLMTVPGYPVAGTHTRYYGGSVFKLPLVEENGFLPHLDSVPSDVCRKAKLLVINYPNSPTGALADQAFYTKVIDFAKANSLVVVQDAAHILLTYGRRPLSFLQIDGAAEVGLEVHSLSKGFNMIGWRIGFVAGHQRMVRAFADIKDNSDSGQFIAIQKAAIAALNDESIPVAVRSKYQRRLHKLVNTVNDIGFKAQMPGGSYFLYLRSPKGVKGGPDFTTAQDASQFLIRERSICTVPWDEAGPYLRFSVTYQAPTEADEDALMASLKDRLANDKFLW
ncbi:MAG: LL-diaminopimelate aminotransferase [Planctomycetota bacterium]|jgi:LL-diaminopimelate aminotransferase